MLDKWKSTSIDSQEFELEKLHEEIGQIAVVTLLASTGSGRVSAATGGSGKKRHQDLRLNRRFFQRRQWRSDEDEKPVANGSRFGVHVAGKCKS